MNYMEEVKKSEILVNDKVIKTEKRRLMKIFEEAIKEDKNGKKVFTDQGILLEGLIDEAAFVRAVLLEAKRLMKIDGIETTTINASQKYKNATPATKIYAEYLRTYTPLVGTLITYIPEKKERKQARLQALMIGG